MRVDIVTHQKIVFVSSVSHGVIVLASRFAERVEEKVANLHLPAFNAELIVLTCIRQIIQVSRLKVSFNGGVPASRPTFEFGRSLLRARQLHG